MTVYAGSGGHSFPVYSSSYKRRTHYLSAQESRAYAELYGQGGAGGFGRVTSYNGDLARSAGVERTRLGRLSKGDYMNEMIASGYKGSVLSYERLEDYVDKKLQQIQAQGYSVHLINNAPSPANISKPTGIWGAITRGASAVLSIFGIVEPLTKPSQYDFMYDFQQDGYHPVVVPVKN